MTDRSARDPYFSINNNDRPVNLNVNSHQNSSRIVNTFVSGENTPKGTSQFKYSASIPNKTYAISPQTQKEINLQESTIQNIKENNDNE